MEVLVQGLNFAVVPKRGYHQLPLKRFLMELLYSRIFASLQATSSFVSLILNVFLFIHSFATSLSVFILILFPPLLIFEQTTVYVIIFHSS